ncbi:hypothetical protein ACIQZI_12460 [Peribacillus sp. NPDC096379]|uniref:hypothetical protein n=1 Tax=Peribacillus sp. NPDC096379 TaxID=3364393 RepID=UPI003810D7F3
MKIINKVEKFNLQEEIQKSKQTDVKLVKVPLLNNFRLVDGKFQYDIEDYIETPIHFLKDEKLN